MSNTTSPIQSVALITDRDVTGDLVTAVLSGLQTEVRRYPAVKPFMRSPVMRRYTVEAAREDLRDGKLTPHLVILDALVRDRASEAVAGDGRAANAFLGWLEAHKPDIPVIVLAPTLTEDLDIGALSRPNVALWNLEPQPTFAQVFASVVSPSTPGPRRVVVDVGVKSARYRINVGHYELTTRAKAYDTPDVLRNIIDLSDGYSPYTPARQPEAKWQANLGLWGNQLFQVLIRDALSPALLKAIGAGGASPDGVDSESSIDVRFEVDPATFDCEKLFKLPFEVVNSDANPKSFFCASVPMARRISMTRDNGPGIRPTPRVAVRLRRKARVLFVEAPVSGTLAVTHEVTGAALPTRLFERLENTNSEHLLLKNLETRGLISLESLGGTRETGPKLVRALERALSKNAYDIFHFSGHSMTVDGGGTFLVLPGTGTQALGVSVRQVADWVRQGHTRLVVLSSCQGASLRTSIETMEAGVDAVLGFRWDVDDRVCAEYFERFYEAYLVNRRPLPAAYRDACRSVRVSKGGTPLWASAVAVVRD